jgi:hypothetical protein
LLEVLAQSLKVERRDADAESPRSRQPQRSTSRPVIYEPAEGEFQILQKDNAETIDSSYTPAGATLAEEERLRSRVFV